MEIDWSEVYEHDTHSRDVGRKMGAEEVSVDSDLDMETKDQPPG